MFTGASCGHYPRDLQTPPKVEILNFCHPHFNFNVVINIIIVTLGVVFGRV